MKKINVLELFKGLTNETVERLGFCESNHPKNMIIEVLLVMPPCARPSVNSVETGSRMEDDITLKYADIIKYNKLILKKKTDDPESNLIQDYINNLREKQGSITRSFVINYINNMHPAKLMYSLNYHLRKNIQDINIIDEEKNGAVNV